MKPVVNPLGNHSFQLLWPETIMTITFKYLIEEHRLEHPYVIQHYQGKPVGQRCFGYYDGQNYVSLRSDEVVHKSICQPIEITDSDVIRPCAVNLFKNSTLALKNGTYHVIPTSHPSVP